MVALQLQGLAELPNPRHLVPAGHETVRGTVPCQARPRLGSGPCLVLILAIAATATPALAQTTAPLTIGEVIDAAVTANPGPAEAAARADAAAAAVDLARAAYLPKLDAMWQVTRASRNNVFGAFFPQNVIPISGPVLGTDSFESAWGSAAGLVFSAEVFDFGRRGAQGRETRASRDAATAHADAARPAAFFHPGGGGHARTVNAKLRCSRFVVRTLVLSKCGLAFLTTNQICVNPCLSAVKISDFVPKIAGIQITPIFGNYFFPQNYHAQPKTDFG